MISAADIGGSFRKGWEGKGSSAEAVVETLRAVAEQRAAKANGRRLRVLPYTALGYQTSDNRILF